MESAEYCDLPQIWYVGPPRCADSENVPLWGGVFRPLRVTSLVTFVKESAGYFDLPQIRHVGPPRCADSENVPLCVGIFRPLRVTSLVSCNFCKGVGGVFRFAPNLVCRASSIR